MEHSDKEKLTRKHIKALEKFIASFKIQTKEKMQENILQGLKKMTHKKEIQLP